MGMKEDYEKLMKDYKELNKSYVLDHAQSANLKDKVMEYFLEVKKALGTPAHEHLPTATSCSLCAATKKVLDVMKANDIGDNVIKMLRQRAEIISCYTNLQAAKALICKRCDEMVNVQECICEEKEEAVNGAMEALEKLMELKL